MTTITRQALIHRCDVVSAQIPDDPPPSSCALYVPGPFRPCLGSDHRDLGMRCQVLGNRRAEHRVAGDQELHRETIARTPDACYPDALRRAEYVFLGRSGS